MDSESEDVDDICTTGYSISQTSCVFESPPQNEEMRQPLELNEITMTDLLQGFKPISHDEFMAYIGLLIISGSLT